MIGTTNQLWNIKSTEKYILIFVFINVVAIINLFCNLNFSKMQSINLKYFPCLYNTCQLYRMSFIVIQLPLMLQIIPSVSHLPVGKENRKYVPIIVHKSWKRKFDIVQNKNQFETVTLKGLSEFVLINFIII